MINFKEPKDMNELVYFTRRKTEDGAVRAWSFKELCPKCKKSLMSKPVDPKTNKSKIREKVYVCASCNNSVPDSEYESSLQVCIEYVCGKCKHEGRIVVPFKRKTYMGVKAIVFECENCKHKIPITKKMKEPKKKKSVIELDDDI